MRQRIFRTQSKCRPKELNLIFGIKGLKVHSKICVIERVEDGKTRRYGFISTGNFNEATAKIYTDVTLFTCQSGNFKRYFKNI